MKTLIYHTVSLFLRLRYRITVKGLEDIRPDGRPILFLPNHQALIDPVIVMSILYPRFKPRPLALSSQFESPLLRPIIKFANMVVIPDLYLVGPRGKRMATQGIEEIIQGLKRGDNILMYPSGRICRTNIEVIGGKSGLVTILESVPNARVVLLRIRGIWGSSFSRAKGVPDFMSNLKKQALKLLPNLILFMPKRDVFIEVVEPHDFPRPKDIISSTEEKPLFHDKETINSFLERFYNVDPDRNTHVPYYWWEGRRPQYLPEPDTETVSDRTDFDIPPSIRSLITDKLRHMSGIQDIRDSDTLAHDLGMDSLALVEFGAWLQDEFGVSTENLEDLHTVSDCLLAATGMIPSRAEVPIQAASKKWFELKRQGNLYMPEADTVAQLFLNKAKENPDQVILSDQISGDKTWRQIVTGIYLLLQEIYKVPEPRVGIMFPPSAMAPIIYLAVIFSGKEPVMVNWTSGTGNIRHCLEITGTRKILTTGALVNRLEKQGIDMGSTGAEMVFMEEIIEKKGIMDKVSALVKGRLPWRTLKQAQVSENAAILFTSGSEARPKAVPLTHKNFVNNVRDICQILSLSSDDSLMGILPIFHSLGLTGTVLLPLFTGLRTVYWPNPNESLQIGRTIKLYRCTTLLATPTFLANILRYARPGWLDSLRLVFTGAESCPMPLYQTFRKICPKAVLCEGYGATECSPVISMNSPQHPIPGSIGTLLPSMEFILVDPDHGTRVRKGEIGKLLVRGPNVFQGYIGESSTPFVEAEGKTWYDTGDLVYEKDGVLFFSGRLKRFVKIGGEMISLPAIEHALMERLPSSDEPVIAVTAIEHEKRPEIVLVTTLDIGREEANEIIRDAGLSPLHHIMRVKKVAHIPVLATGKVNYPALSSILD